MKKHLITIIRDNINAEQKDLLNNFLEFEEKIISKDNIVKGSRYNLTLFKKFEHAVKPKLINENVDKLKKLRQLYYKLEEIINALNLSPEIIQYYANVVSNSKGRDIAERKEEKRLLYLIAFIVNYHYKLHDHLVDALLRVIKTIRNSSKRETEKKYYEERKERAKKEIEIIEAYTKMSTNYSKIIKIINNKNWPDEIKVKKYSVTLFKESSRNKKPERIRKFKNKCLKKRQS